MLTFRRPLCIDTWGIEGWDPPFEINERGVPWSDVVGGKEALRLLLPSYLQF